MKLKTISLLSTLIKLSTPAKEYLGYWPVPECISITKPQKGFWIQKGDNQSGLKFSKECEQDGDQNGKCVISCKNSNTNLILDRTKEGKWDRALEPDVQPKYLVKCKCKTYRDTDTGGLIVEDCNWNPRRYWSEKDYREDYGLTDGEGGDGIYIKSREIKENILENSRRLKRSLKEPRMKFYCEDEIPGHIKSNLNLKNEVKGIRNYKDNKGFTDCGNMYEIFPNSGGEWRCRLNTTDEFGNWNKIKVDPTKVLHKAMCSWGCGTGANWQRKEARFGCVKPWIARPTSKWELKDIWRRFRGFGLRVYKQGMLDCDYFDDNIL